MIHGDSGDIYSGTWLNDQAQGKGSYYHADTGAIYEGDWQRDKQEGFGRETWPDGTEYTGNFLNGMKHGRGRLILRQTPSEFSMYEGDFQENHICGFGIMRYTQSDQRLEYKG
jgi:hypothetical protein